MLTPIRNHEEYETQPLFYIIKDYAAKMKNSGDINSEFVRRRREKIIYLYDKARGILNDWLFLTICQI
jgi:hypothetical protein